MDNLTIYYNLIWDSKKTYKVTTTMKKILADEFYMNEVTLRKSKIKVKIYGKIKDNNIKILEDNIDKKGFNSVPMLKSNLQKCIRRGLTDKAIVTGYNLIQQDFWSFIRRLIIISIEDVSVLENIPFLSWCLLAYPNFNITNEIIQYLLLTVYGLCVSPKKIKINKDKASQVELDYDKILKNEILLGYLIRMEFGGLKGDMAMIKVLLSKTLKKRRIVKIPIKNLVLKRSINKTDIIPSSIDFHITNKLIPYISDNTNIKNHDIIKKTIWFNSSAINYRKKKKDILIKEWKIIKSSFNDFNKNFKIY